MSHLFSEVPTATNVSLSSYLGSRVRPLENTIRFGCPTNLALAKLQSWLSRAVKVTLIIAVTNAGSIRAVVEARFDLLSRCHICYASFVNAKSQGSALLVTSW